ncbi:amino acid synthesis family protein [Rhodococcus opacus]|uniref:Amino acid synthesis family protein n=1 Tax=Rhodococcus opacus TaxID=37919 RepID=A0AAX3Y781_RHOOP|nr:amino acid synthesis family protein [Rhodococcus opacus]MCZ4590036.1 amino acid synthesis family protein [Rhodococcus opacus]WLF44560.1 amino acid synthesis family protein [Rhodococcus opacus]
MVATLSVIDNAGHGALRVQLSRGVEVSSLAIRKIVSHVEEIRSVAGRADSDGPIRKVAVCAVVNNPYAGQGYVEDLSDITDASADIATEIGKYALELLGSEPQSYGKAGLVGSAGEQEHINAAVTSIFGNALRDAIGGGQAWITSVTKPAGVDAVIDVPLAFKDEIWVRSHYDAVTVRVPDAPHADELVIIAAVANRGRINARVGGMTRAEALNKQEA